MTPQPMSDAEITAIELEYARTYVHNVTDPKEFSRAILAARDAQWVAMLGEQNVMTENEAMSNFFGETVIAEFGGGKLKSS